MLWANLKDMNCPGCYEPVKKNEKGYNCDACGFKIGFEAFDRVVGNLYKTRRPRSNMSDEEKNLSELNNFDRDVQSEGFL